MYVCVCVCVCVCADVLDRFRDRLKNLSEELRSCSKRPGESLVRQLEYSWRPYRDMWKVRWRERLLVGMYSYYGSSLLELLQ